MAIVTGAGSSGPGIGNGKATSVLFAREGAKMLLVDAVAERAEETMAMIKEEGGEASVFQANVINAEDCRHMVEAAINHYGRLDILDNNVGISHRSTVVEVSEEDWDYVMAVNVKSMVLASRYAIPRMIETGGGSIINISSIAGLRAHSSTPYTTSKAAVIGLTMSMAAGRMDDDLRQRRKNATPLGTEGTAWDVAAAAVYLASDDARWVTGVVLPVDAGLVATSPVTYTTLPQQRYDRPPLA